MVIVIRLIVMKLHVEFNHSSHLRSMPHFLVLFFNWYKIVPITHIYVDITNLPIILHNTVCANVIR